MTYLTKSIASRIEWCRQQSTQARAPREREGWQAEEAGLRDALFNSDHTTQYQQGPRGVFERYAMGLQDGHALLRAAVVYYQFAPSTRTARTESNADIDGMGDASTRHIHIRGLTRRAETDVHAFRVTGIDKKIMGRVASHGVLPRYREKIYYRTGHSRHLGGTAR